MTTSMVMDMNLGENGGGKQGGAGRRRSKGSHELSQKKNKPPQRGMGVEQLERHIRLQERWKKMTEVPVPVPPSLHPFALPTTFNSSVAFTTSCPNSGVQFRPAPPMLFQGIGIHGASLFSTDHGMDPSSNVGFRFENSKELSSIPNYVKCASDGCGVCHKKKRINGGASNSCSVNPFSRNNTVVDMIDAAKSRRCSSQVTEVMTVHRNGGSSLTEYEFFPGKGGGGESMRKGTTTTTWSGGTSVGGVIGLRGGEGSCVTAITGNEEGSVSSVDLSLKLSY